MGTGLGEVEGTEATVRIHCMREDETKRKKHSELSFCDSAITSDDMAA